MKGRRFVELREQAQSGPSDITTHLKAAMEKIATTPEGEVLQQYLAMEVFAIERASEERAWNELQGKRDFAHQLLSMMEGQTDVSTESETAAAE